MIGIVETNYSYIEPRQINQNPDSKLEEGQEVCTYENMEFIPGNIYIPLDGGKPYVLSNPTKIKNPQFSLFISRERVDIDNATYENCSRSNTKTLWYSDNRGDKHEIDDNSIIPRTGGQCTWYSMGRVSEN